MNIKTTILKTEEQIKNHEEKIKKLKDKILNIQSKCLHPSWERYPQYHGQPDYQCNQCGKWR